MVTVTIKCGWMLIGILLNLYIKFGGVFSFNSIVFQSRSTQVVFPFIYIFKFFQQRFAIFNIQVLHFFC